MPTGKVSAAPKVVPFSVSCRRMAFAACGQRMTVLVGRTPMVMVVGRFSRVDAVPVALASPVEVSKVPAVLTPVRV